MHLESVGCSLKVGATNKAENSGRWRKHDNTLCCTHCKGSLKILNEARKNSSPKQLQIFHRRTPYETERRTQLSGHRCRLQLSPCPTLMGSCSILAPGLLHRHEACTAPWSRLRKAAGGSFLGNCSSIVKRPSAKIPAARPEYIPHPPFFNE